MQYSNSSTLFLASMDIGLAIALIVVCAVVFAAVGGFVGSIIY